MKHISLFSGIGGFSLACDWAGIETILHCEIDDFCQKVLRKHYPNVPIVKDVNNVEEIKAIANAYHQRQPQPERFEQELRGRTLDRNQPTSDVTYASIGRAEQGHGDSRKALTLIGSNLEPTPNTTDNDRREPSGRGAYSTGLRNQQLLLTAGFPCQPFSNAGRKRGANDDRYLWPHTLKVIESVKPDWICLENVAGLLNMVFPDSGVKVASQVSLFGGQDDEIADYDTISGGIDRDLRQAGYETLWLVIPACSIGAPHRRDRVWIVAHAIGSGAGSVDRKTSDERGRTGEDRREGIRQTDRQISTSGSDSADRNVSNSIRSECTGDTRRPARQEFENGLLESESRALADPDRSGSGTPGSGTDGLGQKEGKVNGQFPQPKSGGQSSDASDPSQQGLQGQQPEQPIRLSGLSDRIGGYEIPDWQENWYEVATRFCRVDDGLPKVLDRVNRLKALGNAIVPSVAYQVIKAIQQSAHRYSTTTKGNKIVGAKWAILPTEMRK